MPQVPLKQLDQSGATDGQVVTYDNASGKWIPATPSGDPVVTEASADADDPITSGTDILINAMSLTPGAGDYLLLFSTSAILSDALTEADFTVYVNGVAQTNTIRTIGRGKNQTAGHIHAVSINKRLSGVGAGHAIEIRAAVSAGTLTVFQRTLNLVKVS